MPVGEKPTDGSRRIRGGACADLFRRARHCELEAANNSGCAAPSFAAQSESFATVSYELVTEPTHKQSHNLPCYRDSLRIRRASVPGGPVKQSTLAEDNPGTARKVPIISRITERVYHTLSPCLARHCRGGL
jgi:hypothetical protein